MSNSADLDRISDLGIDNKPLDNTALGVDTNENVTADRCLVNILFQSFVKCGHGQSSPHMKQPFLQTLPIFAISCSASVISDRCDISRDWATNCDPTLVKFISPLFLDDEIWSSRDSHQVPLSNHKGSAETFEVQQSNDNAMITTFRPDFAQNSPISNVS